jgi:uncharacterized protein (TIGR02271 family)
MALNRIKDFDPNYRDHFNGDDVKNLDVYSGTERIGSVDDVLVDDEGRFRYLVINTGAWIFGKKVLLPIGRAQIDHPTHRVNANGLSRQQAENLPEFSEEMLTGYDHDYEEQVRSVYRPTIRESSGVTPLEAAGAVNTSAALDADYRNERAMDAPAYFDRDSYTYDQEPNLFELNDQDHQNLRLYEERLIANKRREKTGEVTVGKRVETETARVAVPYDKERVVIERVASGESPTVVAPGEASFQAGEVARIEVYEETPDIRKEAFVREEVQVRKVVDHDTANAEEQIRREELDIKTDGSPIVENPNPIESRPM